MASAPILTEFVLYGERSVRIRRRGRVCGGDVGVHSVAEPSFGAQVRIGSDSALEREHVVFSPSVSLGRDVRLGPMEANAIEDDGVFLGPLVTFPAAAMPPLPLAPAAGPAGPDVTVGRGEVVALTSGSYGDLALSGTLALNPGGYSFASVRIGDRGRLVAIAGDVRVDISGQLATGREAEIIPAFDQGAGHLVISVAGGDEGVVPAVSLGERSRVRALLSAPHGSVCFADRVHARGAFAAMDIVLGERVAVDFEQGLPATGRDQQGSQQLEGYYGPHPDPAVAPLVGPVPGDTLVALDVGLPIRDPQGLETFIQEVSDPKNQMFRQHLSQAEFYATHGATDADYGSLKAWATSNGLTIDATFPNNLLLSLSAPAAKVEQALYVNLVYRLRADGTKFVVVDREPSLNLSVAILEISGLTAFRTPQAAQVNGTGGTGGSLYRAADLRNAYLGPSSSLLNLRGTNQVVGLFELNSFAQSDIQGYDAVQSPPLNAANVSLNTVQGPPAFTSYSNNVETALDIEMVQAMAPGAQVIAFLGNTGITGHGDTVYHAMATSTPPLTCASCSYTFGRSDNSQQALDQMAAQGVSFFTASGDFGDVGDPQANLNMNNQTLVGGTSLQTNPVVKQPTATTPATYPANYFAGESTWNQIPAPGQKGVTSGGIMDGNNLNGNCFCWPDPECCGSGVQIPGYQVAIMEQSAAANGGSTTYRNYPDVAMAATNLEIFYAGGLLGQGGTSASAPLWAGLMALVNELIQQSDPNAGLAGFVNPTLYDIGLTRGSAVDLYAACFTDIADGVSNANGFPLLAPLPGAGFTSVPGYDLCTGLGSPTPNLVTQLASPTPADAVFREIRFDIGTGHDNLRGNGGFGTGCKGTGCTADVFLPGGGVFTVTLKPTDTDDSWDEYTNTGPIDFPLPTVDNNGNPVPVLNGTQGITGVRINMQQGDYVGPCGADNWDILSLSVSLVAATLVVPPLCQLNLVGTANLQDGHPGLVRLSDSAGPSGVGPSSPVFQTGPGSGCP